MKQLTGIWVKGKWGTHGWLEESTGMPTTFKSLIDAQDWIRVNAVHREYYEPRPIHLKIGVVVRSYAHDDPFPKKAI